MRAPNSTEFTNNRRLGDQKTTGPLILDSGISRGMETWLPGCLKTCVRHLIDREIKAVWLTFADHYEPYWKNDDRHLATERVTRWAQRWPEIAARHVDATGRPPRYTFFYPEEEYETALLDSLAEMTHEGIADVEVHIHHDGEGEQDFIDRMSGFTETLHTSHSLLRRREGKIVFGFIHGNWSLDNSLPNGHFCGLDNEITLLRDLGCYADFTLPSAPSPAQVRMVNTIYWAKDDPRMPKSHDSGIPVAPGGGVDGDLLMIPGPLGLSRRPPGKRSWLPRLETGEMAEHFRPSAARFRAWLFLAPRVDGHVFIKLHTHGAKEGNSAMLLGSGLDDILGGLTGLCGRRGVPLYFASAWEMYLAVDAIRRRQDPVRELEISAGNSNGLPSADPVGSAAAVTHSPGDEIRGLSRP